MVGQSPEAGAGTNVTDAFSQRDCAGHVGLLLLAAHLRRADWWASTNLVTDDITNETLTEVVRRHKQNS